MNDEARLQLSSILRYGVEALDISDELNERLTDAYLDLGLWFRADNQDRFHSDSEVYPQGSKRLGTVVAPVTAADDCDVDLVYRRDLSRTSTTQRQLKAETGEQLVRYAAAAKRRGREVPSLKEGRRCWVLRYAGFHLDVLPALPDDDTAAPDAIIITDRELRFWQSSNPKAYARWFRSRMAVALADGRVRMAKAAGVDIERIPEDRVKTALQRAVQLLKRHRDLWYSGDPDDRPISVIITTLAAHAYNNEADLYAAMTAIVRGMRRHIEVRDGGTIWVPNPTNPDENFADKWESNPERAERFFQWLESVSSALDLAVRGGGMDKVAEIISTNFGRDVGTRAIRRYGQEALSARTSGRLHAASGSVTLGATGAIPVRPHTFYGDGK